ncbi:hypothetical protein CJ739_2570 [Mariniflexile rhizosphaerae]|nr:hypothetical protein CJ739_2570 [Mariniflexile sp. TRM1-10]
MNRKKLLYPITTTLADFLFGFDTLVISGEKKTITFMVLFK